MVSVFSHRHREDKHPIAVSSSTVGQKGKGLLFIRIIKIMSEKVGANRIISDSRYTLFCDSLCLFLTSSEFGKKARAGSNRGGEHGAATENR